MSGRHSSQAQHTANVLIRDKNMEASDRRNRISILYQHNSFEQCCVTLHMLSGWNMYYFSKQETVLLFIYTPFHFSPSYFNSTSILNFATCIHLYNSKLININQNPTHIQLQDWTMQLEIPSVNFSSTRKYFFHSLLVGKHRLSPVGKHRLSKCYLPYSSLSPYMSFRSFFLPLLSFLIFSFLFYRRQFRIRERGAKPIKIMLEVVHILKSINMEQNKIVLPFILPRVVLQINIGNVYKVFHICFYIIFQDPNGLGNKSNVQFGALTAPLKEWVTAVAKRTFCTASLGMPVVPKDFCNFVYLKPHVI